MDWKRESLIMEVLSASKQIVEDKTIGHCLLELSLRSFKSDHVEWKQNVVICLKQEKERDFPPRKRTFSFQQ